MTLQLPKLAAHTPSFAGRIRLIEVSKLERDLEVWLNAEDDDVARLDQAAMFEAFSDSAVLEKIDSKMLESVVYFMTAYYVPVQGTPHPEVAERLERFLREVVPSQRSEDAEARARWHLYFWFDDTSQVAELCRMARGKNIAECMNAAWALKDILEKGAAPAKNTVTELLQEKNLDPDVRSEIDPDRTVRSFYD